MCRCAAKGLGIWDEADLVTKDFDPVESSVERASMEIDMFYLALHVLTFYILDSLGKTKRLGGSNIDDVGCLQRVMKSSKCERFVAMMMR